MMFNRIVFASNNPGKVREVGEILAGLNIEVIAQSEFQVPEVEETGLSFVENAIIKARHAAAYSGLPALADDSGLEVDALLGAPGIYSARFAGEQANDEDNLNKLLAELATREKATRSARFQCLMVLVAHASDPTPLICQGTWAGEITDQPAGDNGFGYDPVFYIPELHCTSAQLKPEQKNAISHRGKALKCLLDKLGSNTFN